MSLHSKVRASHERFARKHVARADGGAIAKEEAKAKAKSAVEQHESHDHKNEPKTKLRLKRGGHVEGKKPAPRLDKRARGGAMKSKHKGTTIVINTGGAEMAKQAGMKQGMQVGAAMAAPKPPMPPGGPMPGTAPRPPMAPPPMGAPPMGAMPPRPMPNGPMPPMRARGGSVPKMTAGAGSAKGRLEKEGRTSPRAKGGKVCD